MTDTNNVDPSEVQDLLKGSADNAVPLDLPPEVAKSLSSSEDTDRANAEAEEAKTPRQTLPDDPFLNPEAVSISQVSNWGLSGNLKDISLSELDKATFFKAAITDSGSPVVFDIDVSGLDYPVKIRSLNSFEELVMHEALRRDQGGQEKKDGTWEFQKRVYDVAGYVTFRQYYHAWLAICEHNGKPRACPEFNGKYSELDKYVEELRTDALDWGLAVPGPLWTILLHALMIFSAKLKLCRENLLNRDFWPPADSV